MVCSLLIHYSLRTQNANPERKKKALILVDIQNDFIPGGALPVNEGDHIIPIVNQVMQHDFDVIVATKDWHPIDHGSFAVNHRKKPGQKIDLEGQEQILWPVHCVQNSKGSDFVSGLNSTKIKKVFHKGTDRKVDSYSAFFDNGRRKKTGLGDYLKQKHIEEVYIGGLATDYCVRATVLDALYLKFKTFVIIDACRGVNLHPSDSEKAFKDMEKAGAKLIYSKDLSPSKIAN